jgi:phosphosulfolactate phosphohydrolase-like enzyme
MSAGRTVKIDALPDSAYRHLERDAVVCIDVLLAGTTIVTALAQGRRAFPVLTVGAALDLARELDQPLLALDGDEPAPREFQKNFGPVDLDRRSDVERPLVLVSPWASLLENTAGSRAVYVACFRNLAATVDFIAEADDRVALLGAGYGGEQRCEDRIAAAVMARRLIETAFEPEDLTTVQEVSSWAQADISILALGKSADYLRRQRRDHELDFVLTHRDDVNLVCVYEDGEVRVAASPKRLRRTAPDATPISLTGEPRVPIEKIIEFSRGPRLGAGRKFAN